MEPMEAGPVEKARLRAMSFAVIGLTCACRVDAGRQRHLYWYSGWPRWPQMKDHSAAGVLSSLQVSREDTARGCKAPSGAVVASAGCLQGLIHVHSEYDFSCEGFHSARGEGSGLLTTLCKSNGGG